MSNDAKACHGRKPFFYLARLLCVIGSIGALNGPRGSNNANAATTSEPLTVAHRVWNAILTHCGESYFYAGSVFDSSGMLSNVQVGHQGTLEFRGVRFNTVPIRVTDAERANGLAYRARITMIAHLYREDGGDWQDGPDLQPRDTDDILAKAIGQANGDMFDMGNSGAIALELVKFKGTWAVTRSSTTLDGSLGFGSNYYDVDKLVAAKVARYSCERSEVVQPTYTPAEIRAATIQRALAAGRTPEEAEALVEANEKLERDKIVIRDHRAGIPTVIVTSDQLDELRSYYDDRGFSKYIDVKDDNGMVMPAEFEAFQKLVAQFPTAVGTGQWLAPGTTYTPVCKVEVKGVCSDVYGSNAPRFADKDFVIVKVTSGPQSGLYALIDMGNYDPTIRVICPAQYPNLKC